VVTIARLVENNRGAPGHVIHCFMEGCAGCEVHVQRYS
jgi:hypothetical protein